MTRLSEPVPLSSRSSKRYIHDDGRLFWFYLERLGRIRVQQPTGLRGGLELCCRVVEEVPMLLGWIPFRLYGVDELRGLFRKLPGILASLGQDLLQGKTITTH